jgi:hypothetical protein
LNIFSKIDPALVQNLLDLVLAVTGPPHAVRVCCTLLQRCHNIFDARDNRGFLFCCGDLLVCACFKKRGQHGLVLVIPENLPPRLCGVFCWVWAILPLDDEPTTATISSLTPLNDSQWIFEEDLSRGRCSHFHAPLYTL